VEIFCNFIEQKYKRLDILINNAAQTVRRPAGFYTHLMENEERSIASLPQQAQNYYWIIRLDELKVLTTGFHPMKICPSLGTDQNLELGCGLPPSQIPYSFDNALVAEVFPEGELDADLQQVDLRKTVRLQN
jgi:hypothetical protein